MLSRKLYGSLIVTFLRLLRNSPIFDARGDTTGARIARPLIERVRWTSSFRLLTFVFPVPVVQRIERRFPKP
jgi:hypothetical protein